MVGFTTAVNSIFVFIIIAAYVFGGHEITAAFGLNLLFYIIITPILTTTLMKLAYAGEAQMQVVDGLKRMGDVMNRQSLKETTNGQIPKDSSVSLRDVTFAYKGAKKMQSIIFPLRSKRENMSHLLDLLAAVNNLSIHDRKILGCQRRKRKDRRR